MKQINNKVGRYLVLNRQISRNFAGISIMHFVIREWILLVLFMLKIYMEKKIKCLRVTYVYLLVRLRGMFILNWHLDASDVIKALVRFLSRGGSTKMFISDNFSSFKSDEVSKFLLLHNIDWKFILSLSPWWGGFYERLVKTVKTTLWKIFGISKLNFEALYSVLT